MTSGGTSMWSCFDCSDSLKHTDARMIDALRSSEECCESPSSLMRLCQETIVLVIVTVSLCVAADKCIATGGYVWHVQPLPGGLCCVSTAAGKADRHS